MDITTSQAPAAAGTLSNHLVKITVGDGDRSITNSVNAILRRFRRQLFDGMETDIAMQAGSGWERITHNFHQWPHGWSGTIRVDASVHLENGMTHAVIVVVVPPHHPAYASLTTGQ